MFQHKKSLGQHFLNNERVSQTMVAVAGVGEGDTVLEIGPGTGALTRVLLAKGARVVALEADERAVEVLQREFHDAIATGQLIVLHGDARQEFGLVLPHLPTNYSVVANIPYYISNLLFRACLTAQRQPKTLVFLVQKEVAERIAREPKESLLSLSVKAYGTPRFVETVKKGNFTPPPKVDSAIIAVSGISRARFTDAGVSETDFFTLLHHAFAGKRKQLLGVLAAYYGRERVARALVELNVRPDIRAEDIPVVLWFQLAHLLT